MTNKKIKESAIRFGKISMLVIMASLISFAVNAQSKQKVAVYITGDVSESTKKVVGAKMVSAITQEDGYAAVERTAEFLAELNKEQSFQHSESGDNRIAKLGEKFGVAFVCVADVSKVYGSTFIAARMINVNTGLIIASTEKTKEINDIEELTSLAEELAAALLNKKGNTTKKSKYSIGEAGPGGGTVFHIEGNTYFEVSHILGDYNWSEAVRIAKNYNGGGFSNWQLPTKDQLNLVYQNLKRPGIVNLGDTWHWSSSEYSTGLAWLQGFSNGLQSNYNYKNNTFSVRAVRAF
jgi:hypothetical protein